MLRMSSTATDCRGFGNVMMYYYVSDMIKTGSLGLWRTVHGHVYLEKVRPSAGQSGGLALSCLSPHYLTESLSLHFYTEIPYF